MNNLFSGISYMQDMTSTICSNATENDSKQLIDKRDGKKYWVTKLKDNNCWMTQNLDLDIEANKIYTSADTDLENVTNKQWQAPADAGTIPEETILSGTIWPNTNNIIKSYDPGDYVYTTPLLTNQCSSSSTGLAGCVSNGWTNVTNGTPSTDANWTGSVDYFTKTYNAHYLAGNYYSWGAATAGQASSLTQTTAGQESTQSICPSGWRLPSNGSNTVDNSYSKLTATYGIANNTTGSTMLRQSPLYFLYGGNVNNGSLSNAGSNGYYWSSTSYSATNAYALGFSSSGVNPSGSNARHFGFSVRCVAR